MWCLIAVETPVSRALDPRSWRLSTVVTGLIQARLQIGGSQIAFRADTMLRSNVTAPHDPGLVLGSPEFHGDEAPIVSRVFCNNGLTVAPAFRRALGRTYMPA